MSFSRSKEQGRRSYSVPLRPDIALCVPAPAAREGRAFHLMDAKFKLTRVKAVFAHDGDDAEKTRQETSRFKRDDLYKMHTYRDAIPTARSVLVLYPGEEQRFFDIGEQLTGGTRVGVGAMPLRPGNAGDRHRLREFVGTMMVGMHATTRASVSLKRPKKPKAADEPATTTKTRNDTKKGTTTAKKRTKSTKESNTTGEM